MHEVLTPERLFTSPPLSRGAPQGLKFSPDGRLLTYIRPAQDDRERLDLWCIDIASGVHRELLNARLLAHTSNDVSELTEAERAERERRRQFAHGITQYLWHPQGVQLIIPMDGQVYRVDPTPGAQLIERITPADSRQSGLLISPEGTYVSYVREADLYVVRLDSGTEQRLTDDGGPLLQNGLADFLAAEEMHRFEGHWWSADEQTVYFTKVDEAPVDISYRLEVEADGARTIAQRYPYAGATNPDVSLWAYDLAHGHAKKIWESTHKVAYLARVHSCARGLLIQTQDRLQQTLTLAQYQPSSGDWRTIFEDRADTWVNLTDDFLELEQGLALTSEYSGTRQALLLEADSGDTPASHLNLQGPTHINRLHAHNASTLWASGWQDDPTENHLFAIALDGSGFQQITKESGWHEVVLDTASGRYLDYFSSITTPPRLSLDRLRNVTPSSTATRLFAEEFDSEHPYAPFHALHAQAVIGKLSAADGQDLYYRLTPPSRVLGQHPTIVYVYGGPGPQKAKNEWSPLLVQLFAQQGFGVLELDNRGTGNRGRDFEAPIYRRMGEVEVLDQVVGLAALDTVAWGDRARVGVYGHSYGGYMTLMCLSRASQFFRSGVAVAPVSDWHLYDSHYTERYMGLPADNRQGYQQANVLSHLEHLQAPLLLMHGMADDNVLFTHSTMIMSRLQQLRKPFELMTYPGAKHSMQEQDVSVHRFNLILDFFKRTLGE